MTEEVHSVAKQIRTSSEAVERYDLAGYDEKQVTSLISDAFGAPLEGKDPVKITFVVGAGKGGRQKYNESLTKFLTAALQKLEFTEDRGASACIECFGTFKQQHDTAKNLLFMHVFPRVNIAEEGAADTDGSSAHSIELLCASCELPTFKVCARNLFLL